MTSASTTLSTPVLKKAIDRYYKQLQDYKGRADYELAVRKEISLPQNIDNYQMAHEPDAIEEELRRQLEKLGRISTWQSAKDGEPFQLGERMFLIISVGTIYGSVTLSVIGRKVVSYKKTNLILQVILH